MLFSARFSRIFYPTAIVVVLMLSLSMAAASVDATPSAECELAKVPEVVEAMERQCNQSTILIPNCQQSNRRWLEDHCLTISAAIAHVVNRGATMSSLGVSNDCDAMKKIECAGKTAGCIHTCTTDGWTSASCVTCLGEVGLDCCNCIQDAFPDVHVPCPSVQSRSWSRHPRRHFRHVQRQPEANECNCEPEDKARCQVKITRAVMTCQNEGLDSFSCIAEMMELNKVCCGCAAKMFPSLPWKCKC